jgi:predicted phage terminase large subunit-like protein
MNLAKRKLHALLRNDFRALTQKIFPTLSPGDEFVPAFYIDAIAASLERVRLGKTKRLIINLPPRSLKSIMASVAFPAFLLGHDPTQRIICVSYSGELAKKFSNDFRAVIETQWYREVFPSTRIGPFKNTETEIEFTARGFRLATSVGGTLTGRGGDIIIIDDPLKPDDAMSESRRTAVNQWFNNVLLSRLDDKQKGAIVVVMQRVHLDDLTGFLTEQSQEWEILSLPAIALVDEDIPLWNGKTHHRKTGDLLSPRDSIEVLENLKLQLGSAAFSAQYLQSPEPPGGAMVKRHWIRRYTELPPEKDWLMVIQSWDTASKGGPENDYSVCTTWIKTRFRHWYLVDVWRGRLDFPSLVAKVVAHAEQWGARRILVEDTSAGTGLLQSLSTKISGIVAVKPEKDKESRMSVASAKMEAGQVFFPERASWLPDLEMELFLFPGSRFDDQCDSISQALLDDKTNFMDNLTHRQRQELLAAARNPRIDRYGRPTSVFF